MLAKIIKFTLIQFQHSSHSFLLKFFKRVLMNL